MLQKLGIVLRVWGHRLAKDLCPCPRSSLLRAPGCPSAHPSGCPAPGVPEMEEMREKMSIKGLREPLRSGERSMAGALLLRPHSSF